MRLDDRSFAWRAFDNPPSDAEDVFEHVRHPPRFSDGEAERLETVFYESRLQSLTGCGNLKGHRGVLFGRTAEPS